MVKFANVFYHHCFMLYDIPFYIEESFSVKGFDFSHTLATCPETYIGQGVLNVPCNLNAE